MKISTYLRKVAAMPVAGLEELGAGGATIVAPHPDDEVLGTGGLIAACLAARLPVNVVVLSDGAGSHPNSRRWPPARLAELRREECRSGLGMLGLQDEVSHLDLPDTKVPTSGALFDTAAARIDEAVHRNGSTSLFVTWDKDPHCDHFAAARLARAVAQARPGLTLWHYPIWGWHLPRHKHIHRPDPEGFRLDIAPWLERKRAAIACHASQVTRLIDDDPDGFTLTAEHLRPFDRPMEYFIRGRA